MAAASHQTVRLSPGKHRSPTDGACVMELASMLAGERFTDRPQAVSPAIGAFLRTYNDGIDAERRQDLYAYAAKVVGTRDKKAVEQRRVDLCIALARHSDGSQTRRLPTWAKACVSLCNPEAAGTYAARAALAGGLDAASHREALAFVDRLIGVDGQPADLVLSKRLRRRQSSPSQSQRS